jgi:hypothetical protein
LKAGEKGLALFKKPEAPKVPDVKAPAQATKVDEGLLLAGPPFKFQVEILDAQNKPSGAAKPYTLKILEPAKYFDIPQAAFTSQNSRAINRWAVSLKALAAQGPFPGPDCKVKLELAELTRMPEPIPLLKSVRPRGTSLLESKLTPRKLETQLFAANLEFDNRLKTENGLVYVSADDYARAFIFDTTFELEGNPTPQLLSRPDIHIAAKRYARPDKMAPYQVTAEVDNLPLDEPVTVELGLDLDMSKDYSSAKAEHFKGPRKQQIWLLPGSDDGGLPLRTKVEEWSHAWDVAGALGERIIWARLRDKDGNSMLEDKGKAVDAIFAKVTFIDTAPEGVKFVKLPATVELRREPLEVSATTSDPKELIQAVVFFLGKPVEGIISKGTETFPGVLQEVNKSPVWTANVPLPPDLKGLMPVSVQFTNQVGLNRIETKAVQVQAAAPTQALGNAGKITGVVVEGESRQPKLPVVLKDPKGMIKARGMTNDAGEFEFKDVAPGQYKVSATKDIPSRKGEKDVEVKAGETTETMIELEM